MNAVVSRLAQLERRNYVRKAGTPYKNYWHDWSFNEMQRKRQAAGDEFYLILYGSPEEESDFFVIPYEAVKHILTEDNLADLREGDNRRRWIGTVRGDRLKFSHCDTEVDLTPYKGNLRLLEYAVDGFRDELSADEGDTADDEAAYIPTGEDSRRAVLRQIKARRGQQAFRDGLRSRYGDRCMISGCRLMDVVEAAHINPHRGDKDNHAANGLLLRADLHTLYDLNFIGIDPETLTVHVHADARGAGYEEYDGKKLLCDEHRPSPDALAGRWKEFMGNSAGDVTVDGARERG